MNSNYHSATLIDVQVKILLSCDGRDSSLIVAFYTFFPFCKGSSINNMACLKETPWKSWADADDKETQDQNDLHKWQTFSSLQANQNAYLNHKEILRFWPLKEEMYL